MVGVRDPAVLDPSAGISDLGADPAAHQPFGETERHGHLLCAASQFNLLDAHDHSTIVTDGRQHRPTADMQVVSRLSVESPDFRTFYDLRAESR
jgi:hypothetical protein